MQPKLDIGTWYKITFLNGLNFKGRASRREFWTFVLVNFGIGVILGILEGIGNNGMLTKVASGIAFLFNIITYVPSLAVSVRRVHDTNHSAWWVFGPALGALVLIPMAIIGGIFGAHHTGGLIFLLIPILIAMVVCSIAVFIFTLMEGTPSVNNYGDVPLYDAQGNLLSSGNTPVAENKEYSYIKRD